MGITIERVVRNPLYFDAVQVSSENIEEVAEWCKGEVILPEMPGSKEVDHRYIKVRVHEPRRERQTKAYITDWVIYGVSFKVYTDHAFQAHFKILQDTENKE